MQKTLGWIMLLIGISMLFAGYMVPMFTVTLDTTPPLWIIASDGAVAIFPRNGEVYQKVDKVQAGVNDPESGVDTVVAKVDGTMYSLHRQIGTDYSGVWITDAFTPLSTGQHTMTLTATNKNGLSTTYTATFAIYTSLQGKWYVNDIEITDPAQIIRLTTYTITFKFVKTQGVPDNQITCTAEWSGPEAGTITLTNTATNTWTGTKIFTKGGTYTITLKANDGTNVITMNIFGVDIGELPPEGFELPQVNMLQIFGLASMGIGLLLIFTDKTRAKKR